MKIYTALGHKVPHIDFVETHETGPCPTCRKPNLAESSAQARAAGEEFAHWLHTDAHGSFFQGVITGMKEARSVNYWDTVHSVW